MANTLKFGNGQWATKKGSALAYNDENGNFKPLPFNFERASGATRVNKNGLIEVVGNNEPRIDFLNDSKGALLLEPSRTNILPYSNDYSQSVYTKRNCDINQNYALSPSGDNNATLVSATGSDAAIYDKIGVTSGITYTLSVYLRVENETLDTSISLGSAGFPNTSGDGGRVKNITVTTEWQRFSITSTADANASSDIGIIGGFGGFNNGDSVYIWGAQLEVGYTTSYIPTQGGIGTRVAEICTQTPPSGIIGQTEGTIFIDVDINTLSTDGQVLRLTNGTSGTGRIAIERNVYNQNQLRITQWGGATLYFPISVGNRYKIAVGYDSSNSNVYVNGSSIGTSFFTNVAELNKVSLGCNEVGGSIFNDTIKETKLYNTRLTNAELQSLTTI